MASQHVQSALIEYLSSDRVPFATRNFQEQLTGQKVGQFVRPVENVSKKPRLVPIVGHTVYSPNPILLPVYTSLFAFVVEPIHESPALLVTNTGDRQPLTRREDKFAKSAMIAVTKNLYVLNVVRKELSTVN